MAFGLASKQAGMSNTVNCMACLGHPDSDLLGLADAWTTVFHGSLTHKAILFRIASENEEENTVVFLLCETRNDGTTEWRYYVRQTTCLACLASPEIEAANMRLSSVHTHVLVPGKDSGYALACE